MRGRVHLRVVGRGLGEPGGPLGTGDFLREAGFHVAIKSRVAGEGIKVDHKVCICLDGGRVGRGGGSGSGE